MFIQDVLANGQLQLGKIPEGKNQATVLTKHLSASNLHRLLPKLGVRTRAADSKDLLAMVSEEVLASSREEKRSFFIGMMAQQLVKAQLVPPSVASRACQASSLQKHCQESSFHEISHEEASRDCQDSSLHEHHQEEGQRLKASQRTASRTRFATLLRATIFAIASFINFQFSSLLLHGLLSIMQLCLATIMVFEQCVSRSPLWTRALRPTTSTSASKSLSATSLQRTKTTTSWIPRLLAVIFFISFLGDTALNLPVESLYVMNALSSRPSFLMSFHNYSISDHLAEGSMASFQQGELLQLLLAHEASNLPGAMLEQLSAGKLGTKELEEQITEALAKHNDELEEGHNESEEQHTKLGTKAIDKKTTELAKQGKELEEYNEELGKWIKELEEQQADFKTQNKEFAEHSKELEEQTNQLEKKNKELEKQQAGLDIALVKAVLSQLAGEEKELDFNMMIGEEACKSFTQIASTQLPQQDVKGAWLEQLASEQQLLIGSFNIGFDNFIVKYAAFKKKKELSQNSFSESSFSANSLQTSLAKSTQWPSLFSKNSTRLMEHQLLQQESALGSHDPRACTAAFQRPCWQHNHSSLASQQKVQEQQLSQAYDDSTPASALQRTFWQNGLQLP